MIQEQEIKKETTKKKKRKKKHYLLRLVVIAAICVGLYFILSASVFDVDNVEVRNNDYFTTEQVLDLAGVKNGSNIFFDVKAGNVKRKLLADPYVKNVKVSRKLPSTLVIKVEERKEKAAIKYGDSYIILDIDGLVLRQSDVEPKVTMIEGLTLKSIEPGKALDVEENYEFSGTLDLIRVMDEGEIFFKKIDISGVRVKAYIYDQFVCIGTPDVIVDNLKNGSLKKVLYELYNQNVKRGTITISADGTCAFSAAVEEE